MKRVTGKVFVIIFTLVMSISLFTGCGNDKGNGTSPSPAVSSSPALSPNTSAAQ